MTPERAKKILKDDAELLRQLNRYGALAPRTRALIDKTRAELTAIAKQAIEKPKKR